MFNFGLGLGSDMRWSGIGHAIGLGHAMLPCDRGPYVFDSGNHSADGERSLFLGVGSSFQHKRPSLIHANAARLGWVGELFNSLDGTDYTDFFGLRDDDSCDVLSMQQHLATGALRRVTVRKSYLPELLRTCRRIEACGGTLLANHSHSPTLRRLLGDAAAGAASSVLVFRFEMARSYRELLNYCTFTDTVRGRFHRARNHRGRIAPKRPGEVWIAVHFRWGDVRTGSVDKPNFRTVGLSQLLRAALAVQRSLAASSGDGGDDGRGSGGVRVDFYSEGNASEFDAVLAALPGTTLHLGSSPQDTRDSLDRMSSADVLVGGGAVPSSFFVLAAHLCDTCVVVTTPRSPKFFPTTVARPPHHRLVDLATLAAASPSAAPAAFRSAWAGLVSDRARPRPADGTGCDASTEESLPPFNPDVLSTIPAWNRKQLCGARPAPTTGCGNGKRRRRRLTGQ